MSKKFFIRTISMMLAVFMLSTLFVGCGKSSDVAKDTSVVASSQSTSGADVAKPAEKSNVDFWYLWGGNEQKKVENFIAAFNKSQVKYEVKGLYIADMQKVKIAIAGGTGPDITDDFDGNVASYSDEGILQPLDEYIQKDGLKFDDYVSGSLDTCKYKGKTYALPAGITFFMMYYNKTLLQKAGYTEPPKTQKELLDMAIKTTEVNPDKSIKVLGFPEFPVVYYLRNMAFASGVKYYSDDGKFTPNDPAAISSLNLIRSYRQKFGVDNVLKFDQAGKYNEATDPFVTGNQVFRLDGQWFANSIINDLKVGKDKLDFGICPIPYPEGKPELTNSAQVTSSIFYIPANAKNKDGAWELMKYIHSGEFSKYMQSLPVLKSLMDDAVFKDIPNFKDFGDFAKVAKFSALPANAKAVELFKLVDDQAELALNLKKTSEDAMTEAATKGNKLLGK
jgi:multiple sugar transport system substrate-binding protein